jgi:tetratricopeptide (TPR) repeat protein
LKHTVFHTGEDIEKARKMEIGHKFFIVDNLREKGNRRYRKAQYEEALQFYERGVSVLKWLYCQVDMNADPFDTSKLYKKYQQKAMEEHEDEDSKSNFASDCESKVMAKFKLDSDTESILEPKPEEPKKFVGEDEWLNDRFSRLLLTTFHDGNVKLFDGEEYTQPNEIDMRNSMLFYLYINMACCYMHMKHFSEARILLDDAKKLSPTNSLYLFRSAQARAYSLDSNEEELNLAIKELEEAKEVKKTEKIFQHPEHLLKMLNVHNLDNALEELKFFTENRVTEMTDLKTTRLEQVFTRVAQINEVEKMIISEGKVPEDGPDIYSLLSTEEDLEDKILRNMLEKYLTVIDFYQETKDEKQVKLAKNEFLQHKRVYDEFAFYWHLNLDEPDAILKDISTNFCVDLKEEKMQKRTRRILKEHARQIFEAGKFNLELFQYVIEEHYKQKQDEEDKVQKEKEEQEEGEEQIEGASWYSSVFGARSSAKGRAFGWVSVLFILTLFAIVAYSFWPSASFSSF